MKIKLGAHVWAAIIAAVALAGCAGTAPDHFYRLADAGLGTGAASSNSTPTSTPTRQMPTVSVTAVSVPDLVDRPQIVTLGPGSRVQLSEQHRWAEPLKLAIGRLVADRIAAGLGSALVTAYPADPGVEAAYRVSLSVQRFDSELGTAASSTVLWTVRRTADGQQRAGRTVLNQRPLDASFDAIVQAHAQALGRIGDEVAQVILVLQGP